MMHQYFSKQLKLTIFTSKSPFFTRKIMEKPCKLQHAIAAILLFQYVVLASTAIPNNIITDQSSLLALKSSISEDPENILAPNWSSSTPVCSWIGVICSKRRDQRVTGLNLSNMDLRGIIPPQLGNLSFLVSLNITNNRFHGELPEELAKLRRLRSIDLGRNNFTGPFPSIFSSLPNLQWLYLPDNEFSGPIPSSVANISKLQYLYLGRNFLEGNLPQHLCHLRSLQVLHVAFNQLTGHIPPCIFNLTTLRILDFTQNKLRGKLPEDICDNNSLPNLVVLGLSSNELDGTIPPALQKCSQLQILSLSYSKFTGRIPREIGNLTRLTRLCLGGLNLEGEIPSEIGNLQRLEVFGLSECGLGGSLPETIFNISTLTIFSLVGNFFTEILPTNIGLGTPNLQELYLDTNNFRGPIPDSLSNASKLTVLELSDNSFTGPIPDWIGNFKGLRYLNLGLNQFTNPSSSGLNFLTSLTKCRQLNELLVGGNHLTGRLPTSIGNFSNSLTRFSAGRCGIMGEIPEEMGNLSSLARLDLFGNELIGSIPTSIRRLEQLQQLYLFNNSLTGAFREEICSLKNLGAIRLNSNQISGPLPACIEDMTSLRLLHLSSNRLNSTLPAGIWNLNDLLEFTASSNMLSGHLPPEIGNLKAATLIDLSTNMLSGSIPTTVDSLESLLYLDLADNRFEGPIPDSFSKILSLEVLNISGNNLTGEIPKSLEALKYLGFLNLSFNKLSGEIPNGGPFVNFTSQSFLSNKALCGASRFQVPPCEFRSPDRSRALLVAMDTTLGVAATIALLIVILVLLKRQRKRKEASQTQTIDLVTHQRIIYYELQEATNGFSESNVLGEGGYSSVYKGTLRDGALVAVKVFNMQLEGAFKSFDKECEVLRSLRHRNLTKVISSCTTTDFRALVLEYMPSGSLEKWLYSHNYFLDILQRLNIVIDVTGALDYLHTGCITPVIHCDLKPSNVLLDEEMVGHVSDFGISKILGGEENIAQTKTMATIGYMAPEYGSEGLVSTRSDIYSYGILLMETFTRRKPSDEMFAAELSLKQWVKDSLPKQITKVIDSNLLTQGGGSFDAKLQCSLSVMEVALKCTGELPYLRINMKDAATALNKIKARFLRNCGGS